MGSADPPAPSLGDQTAAEASGDASYGSNETTLAFVVWLPKVTKLLQSKSGSLYLAVPVGCCGLCLGPLGFRLHCILLNECVLDVISACVPTFGFTRSFFSQPFSFLLAFLPVCWCLRHRLFFSGFWGGGDFTQTLEKNRGERSAIPDHFSSPLSFGIKGNHGCARLGGKECTRS